MCSFIGKAHGVVVAVRANQEEMMRNMSRVESYSHTLEDQIVSLCEEIRCLLQDFEESQEKVSQCHHEVKAQGEGHEILLSHLKQVGKELEEAGWLNFDYVTCLTKLEEDWQQLAIQLSIVHGEKASAEAKKKEVKLELRGHDQRYSQLYELFESYKRKLLDSELRVAKLVEKLMVSREEVVHLSPQIVAARSIQNRAWGLGHKFSIKQLKNICSPTLDPTCTS